MMKGPRKLGTPTNVTVEYENSNVQPIHIFVKGMETFSPANRLDPDSDRTATIPFTNGQIVEFHAGRNGEVLAVSSVKLSPRNGYLNEVYDEDGVFSIGTAPAAPDGEILSFKNFLALLGGTVKDADGEDLDPPFLNPGNVRMQAGQGADIGPINTTTPVPNMSLDWLDKDVNRPINRSQGYLVRWSGGDPGREHVGIFGQSFLEGATGNFLTTGFICTAPVSANQFMIPADVLMRLAPTQQGGFSQLYVGTIPLNNAGRFSATGLESGHFGYTKSIIRSVTYQ